MVLGLLFGVEEGSGLLRFAAFFGGILNLTCDPKPYNIVGSDPLIRG